MTSKSWTPKTPLNSSAKSPGPSLIAPTDEEWLDRVFYKLVKPSMNSNSADDHVLRHFSEAARHIQKGLVVSLSSMDFLEYEGMVLRANEAFNIMNSLSTDYLPFYDSVKEFIKCSALLA